MENDLDHHRFTSLFNTILYPENIFILCNLNGADKFLLENFSLLSHILVAIVIFKTGNSSEVGLDLVTFQSFSSSKIITNLGAIRGDVDSKPFFILDLEEELSANLTKHIYETFDYETTVKVMEDENDGTPQLIRENIGNSWKPTLVIINQENHVEHHDTKLPQPHVIAVFQNVFGNSTLHLDSSIFFAIFSHHNLTRELNIWEIYNVKQTRIISQTGTIVLPKNHKELTSNGQVDLNCYGRRRRRFRGEKFTALVKDDSASNQDWVKVENRTDGSFYLVSGYLANIYWDMKMLMNFTEEIVVGDSPVALENGSLVGKTVNLLRSEVADFSLHKMSLNPPRGRTVSFLFPTHNGLVYAFFKQPSPSSVRNIVSAPFQKKLWFTLLTFWMMLHILFRIHLSFLEKLSKFFRNRESVLERDRSFLKESWIWCIGAVCQKAFYLEPQSGSLKLKFLVASLLSIISYTAYSASIVSSLAVSNIPIKSFLDLVKSNFFFTVHEQSQPFQNLLRGIIYNFHMPQKVATVSTEKEISHLFTVTSSTTSWSTSTGDEFVHSTNKVFLSYADMFYKMADFQNYTGSFVCHHLSFFKLEFGYYLGKGGMFVKKGSQYKEVLNFVLLRLRGIGLTYRHDKNYNSGNVLQCLPDEIMSHAQATDFSDIFTILLILLHGIPLALIAVLAEIIISRYQKYVEIMS